MERIFRGLAGFALVCVALTFLLGLSLRSGDIRNPDDLAARQWASVHRLAGISACLAVLLIDSIVVTYFIGTSRWAKEVCETYALDRALIDESARLKRVSFPWALMNMLTAGAIVVLGGASDPSATTRLAQPAPLTWSQLHLLSAGCGMLVIGWGFWRQWQHVADNHALIETIVEQVRKVRVERGWDSGTSAT